MAISSFLHVSEIFLVASSAFASRLQGKSRLRVRVVGPAEPVQPHRKEKFENKALFQRLGLPSTLIRHENGAFQKRTLFKPEDLKMAPALRFSQDRKHFENGSF